MQVADRVHSQHCYWSHIILLPFQYPTNSIVALDSLECNNDGIKWKPFKQVSLWIRQVVWNSEVAILVGPVS